MAASDLVTIIPGASPLQQMANSVNADAGAINSIANAWQKASGKSSDEAQAVGKSAEQALEPWRGSGADAFSSLMDKFGTASANTEQTLDNAGQALSAAAENLATAHKNIESICQTLYDDVINQPKAQWTKEPITGWVQQAISQASSQITQVESELGPIVTSLQGYLSAMKGSQSFSALSLPSGGTFDPTVSTSGSGLPSVPGTTAGTTGTGGISLAGTAGGNGSGSAGGTGGGGTGSGGSATSPGGFSDPQGFGQVPIPTGTPAAPGTVNTWITEAMKILEENGVPASELNANDIWIIIQHESSGNPNAVNNWDSNAAAGTPSEGLMQTIGPTFNAYALPGHTQIFNPVDNIIAGVRYAISRYGSLSNVPGVKAVNAGEPYVGY
jgi:uncharacterized protein YukE